MQKTQNRLRHRDISDVSAAKKFAIAGSIGIASMCSAVDAGAQDRLPQPQPYEPMPMHLMGFASTNYHSETTSYRISPIASRIFMTETDFSYTYPPARPEIDNAKCDSDKAKKNCPARLMSGFVFRTGIFYEMFRGGVSAYNIATGAQRRTTLEGHALGIRQSVVFKDFLASGIDFDFYNSMGLQGFSASVPGAYFTPNGRDESVSTGFDGFFMGQMGIEARPVSDMPFGISRFGLGEMGGKGILAYTTIYGRLLKNGQSELRTALTPHFSSMNSEGKVGGDAVPAQFSYTGNRWALRFSSGVKAESNLQRRDVTIVPYAELDYLVLRKSFSVDISGRYGCIISTGGNEDWQMSPTTGFGELRLGLLF